MAKITVQNTDISVVRYNEEDYISLTDMARSQLQEHIIFRWLSLKSTIEYLGEWEMLYNPDFNCTEFGTIKNAAGSNNFVLSVKTWIERTGAIGIRSKAGRCTALSGCQGPDGSAPAGCGHQRCSCRSARAPWWWLPPAGG